MVQGELMNEWRAELIGLHGRPVHHAREYPDVEGRFRETERNDLMPTEGLLAGMSLSQFEPRDDDDPVCLYNRFDQIVHQWPDGYIPGWGEVRDKVKEILREEGRDV